MRSSRLVMQRITLTDAIYSPFASELVGKSVLESVRDIRAELRKHISVIGQGRAHSYEAAGHHYICSTMMDSMFSAAAVDPEAVMAAETEVPRSFTHAYECACWGFCLSYHLQHKPHDKLLIISIMDVNSMEMSYWTSNAQWGKSGFGLMTLCFELTGDDCGNLLHTGMGFGGNDIIAFASIAKQVVRDFKATTLSLPFFPEKISIPVRRSLKGIELLSERHSDYGHAFGSDPWISFIRDHAESDKSGQRIVFGSLALRGYYCFADIFIAPNINVHHFTK
jgi:hypothetical protein